jgi:hypothetical protein
VIFQLRFGRRKALVANLFSDWPTPNFVDEMRRAPQPSVQPAKDGGESALATTVGNDE